MPKKAKNNFEILKEALSNKEPVPYIIGNILKKLVGLSKTYKPKRKLSENYEYNVYLNKLYDWWFSISKTDDKNLKEVEQNICFVIFNEGNQSLLEKSLSSIKNNDKDVKIEILNNGNSKSTIDKLRSKFNNNTWYIFLRSGDTIFPWTVNSISNAINSLKNESTILFDHDSNYHGKNFDPYLKPFFNKRYLYEYNYIQNGLCISHKKLESIQNNFKGKFFEAIYGWLLNQPNSKFKHIQRPLLSQGSEFRSQYLCLNENKDNFNIDSIEKSGMKQNVKFQCINTPMVSIIIPFRDKPELLKNCVESILKYTTYPKYEIILADNNSVNDSTNRIIEHYLSNHENIRSIKLSYDFNFSKINNDAVKISTGELLLFLNNDTEVLHKDWLSAMVAEIQPKDVAAVGPLLLYEDQTVQHAGVVPGIGHVAGHIFRGFDKETKTLMSRLESAKEVAAVTGACLLTTKNEFELIGGFDEKNLRVAYNDVDYCFNLLKLNKKIIFTPHVQLIHFESKSRKFDMSKGEKKRYDQEVKFIKDKHSDLLESNQFYHPAFSRATEDYSFNDAIFAKARISESI